MVAAWGWPCDTVQITWSIIIMAIGSITLLPHFTVVFTINWFQALLFEDLPSSPELCAELEKILMAFPQPALSFPSKHPIGSHRRHSWMRMLEKFFPALAERGALTINAEYCKPCYSSVPLESSLN